MQRTNILELAPNKQQRNILKECMFLSSCVYNSTNYLIRQQFFNKEPISNFYQIWQKMQNTEDYQFLGRSYALPRIKLYAETNSARFKLIKSGTQKRVGLPKYLKNRKTNTTIPSYLVIDNDRYSIKKNHIIIPLSRQMRNKYGIKHFNIKYNGLPRWEGKQQRGQIRIKNGKFYLHQSVEVQETKLVNSNIKAGLDLGIKRLLSIYINNGESRTIGSKRFYKQWIYYTDLISQEQEKLAKINKKTSKNLQKLYNLRKVYQENLYNNLVAKMFRILKRNNVSSLVMGDITHICDSGNKGTKVNQMINNYWSFDMLSHKIQNKAEELCIELLKETEEYTSRTCPICGDNSKSNCKDRIFQCSFCDYVNHRDIVGARNILGKSMYGSSSSIHWAEISPLEVSI